MKSINNMNTLEMTMPVGYLFCWRPMDSGPDLSTAQKVQDYFGFGEWKACYGRNLLLSTDTMPGLCTVDSSGATYQGTVEYQSDGSALVTNSNSNTRFRYNDIPVQEGVAYTVSAYYKEVSGDQQYQFQMEGWTESRKQCTGSIEKIGVKEHMTGGWIKSYLTFIPPSGTKFLTPWFRSGLDYELYTHSYYIKHIKLELGTEPTDWTPAPEDIRSSLSFLPTDYKCYRRIA